jgi:hypothetical protein
MDPPAIERAMTPTVLPPDVRRSIFAYVGGLMLLVALADPNGGVMDVPISFVLKNKLHLEAHELAVFRAIAAAPLYVAFIFGLLRDNWTPRGFGDRAQIAVFSVICVALYVLFAFLPATYTTLLIAVILLTTVSLFVTSAQDGLTATLGQQHAMTGQVSAVWNAVGSIPAMAALLLGGYLSDLLERQDADGAARILFLVGAGFTALVVLYAGLRPRSVFDNVAPEHGPAAHPWADLKRLARHRPIYPAMAIWLLWNFAPGSTTPLQYHLQNALHAADSQWGVWNAIFAGSFIPTFVAFGYLCQRIPLKRLLWWGTIVAIPQFTPLLFIQSATGALFAAVPIGLMGGIATAAYLDLIIRSCPPGLQGSTLMLSGGLYFVSSRFGDILGTYLYDFSGGFSGCVIMITLVYAAILPALHFVPDHLVDYRDGEAPAARGA